MHSGECNRLPSDEATDGGGIRQNRGSCVVPASIALIPTPVHVPNTDSDRRRRAVLDRVPERMLLTTSITSAT